MLTTTLFSFFVPRFFLKRIAKDNVRKFGRLIGKLSHSNPASLFVEIFEKVRSRQRTCLVWDGLLRVASSLLESRCPFVRMAVAALPCAALTLARLPPSQVQAYENMILPLVDSFKYLTPLAFDVLSFCLIEVRPFLD